MYRPVGYSALRVLARYDVKKYATSGHSANKPSFQNLTKSLFVQRSIDVKSAVTF